MEQILNHLLVLSGILGAVFLAHMAWIVSGFGNKVVKGRIKDWSWKRCGKDLVKLLCFSVSMLTCSITTDIITYYISSLEIGALDALMSVISWGVIVVIPLIGAGYLEYRALKNNKSIIEYDSAIKELGITEGEISVTDNSDKMADDIKKGIGEVFAFFDVPDDLSAKHLDWEKGGGLGTYYSVPHNTYDAFRAATIGKGFNIDNAYGAQCYDLAGLLWQQLGKTLLTGNGCAYGCWTLKRDYNAGSDFTLITNKNDVKRGDVVVFSGGQYGHIGYADEDYNGAAYIRILGQNQGGTAYPGGGSYTNVVNVSMAGFLGAFRYKAWATTTPTPTPKPEPKPETKPTPTPTPSNDHHGFSIGDVVVPTKKVDAFGTKLVQYDKTYVITGWRDDVNGAILSARGTIWAVMPFSSFKKA